MKFRTFIVSLLAAAALLCAFAAAAGTSAPFELHAATVQDEGTVLYVAPDGSDTNAGSLDKPFATLDAARQAARKYSADGNVTVKLRGGTYRITEPVRFTPEDSGKNGHTVTYEAYEDEVPVLSGAVQVTGWTKYNDKLWSAYFYAPLY